MRKWRTHIIIAVASALIFGIVMIISNIGVDYLLGIPSLGVFIGNLFVVVIKLIFKNTKFTVLDQITLGLLILPVCVLGRTAVSQFRNMHYYSINHPYFAKEVIERTLPNTLVKLGIVIFLVVSICIVILHRKRK